MASQLLPLGMRRSPFSTCVQRDTILTFYRTYRQMCGLKNMGYYEGRQRYGSMTPRIRSLKSNVFTEFSGTLLGFDDYVSEYHQIILDETSAFQI